MPRPRKPELEDSRKAFKALKPLPRNYGMWIDHHFPEIDLQLLYRAVAGRVEYPAGLKALEAVCLMYPRKPKQQALAKMTKF